jgi:CBS-domain-containing membrane protein
MAKGNLKRLPVIDRDEHLVGMLARIDVLRIASSGSSRREILKGYGAGVASTTPVGRASLLDVPTVSPDTAAEKVMDLIDEEGQRVVVVDDAGHPLGVISDRDLLPLLDPRGKDRAGELTAASLMRMVPTVTQDTGVEEALAWMVEHRRKRLPVVDGEDRYVGMLSREELLRILAPEPESS